MSYQNNHGHSIQLVTSKRKSVCYLLTRFISKFSDECVIKQQINEIHIYKYILSDRKSTRLHKSLTHWGRVTHICVDKLTIIGSDNGLSPRRRQAIIWTNAGILLNRSLRTNFSEISIRIQTFSFKKMHLKMSSAKWRPFCLGLKMLMHRGLVVLCVVIDFCRHWLRYNVLLDGTKPLLHPMLTYRYLDRQEHMKITL